MPKDSQPDPKEVRKAKANGQTPLTRENQNHNRNAKKKSIRNNDVSLTEPKTRRALAGFPSFHRRSPQKLVRYSGITLITGSS